MQNSTQRQLCFLRAACVLAALTISESAHAADITYETRALTWTDGPLGPGLGTGVSFSSFSEPVLNDAGQTAFLGILTGPEVTSMNDRGLWSEGGGLGLALIARTGNHAPGTAAGVSFSGFFSDPVLNDAGQTVFWGRLTGTGVASLNDSGIWSEGGGAGLALVAREGSQAPGTAAGVNFSGFTEPGLNGSGQTAFLATLTGTGVTSLNDSGIWSEGGGAGLALIAREGDQAPGTVAGVYFFGGFSFNGVLNDAGQTAFSGRLAGTGVTSSNDRGIWSEGGGAGLALIAREADQAPGTAVGVKFSSFGSPVLNNAGQTAFSSFLTGTGVTSSNDRGIWSRVSGASLALVARTGDPAPGTPAGVKFSGYSFMGVLNGTGQTAFFGFLTGAGVDFWNDGGIWSQSGGSGLKLVTREGDPAPGTGIGVSFSGFNSPELNSPVLNGAGQIAFGGGLSGTGVTSSNDSGIWATDPEGLLHLVAREGDLFDVSNDPLNPDPRTILTINMVPPSGGEDGRGISLNNAGQLAFRLTFTDGSQGIFVATISSPTSPLTVTMTQAIAPATGYDFSWNSRPGKVYDLVSSTNPVTPVAQWPVHAAYGDIPATGTTTTLMAVPVDGPQRFFAVIEKDAPLVD